MHIVMYIENKLLFIFIALFYRQYIPYDFYFAFSDRFFEENTVYYPFYPLPNFMVYLFKITGLGSHYSGDPYFHWGESSILALI